jgi:hypothetical protein
MGKEKKEVDVWKVCNEAVKWQQSDCMGEVILYEEGRYLEKYGYKNRNIYAIAGCCFFCCNA